MLRFPELFCTPRPALRPRVGAPFLAGNGGARLESGAPRGRPGELPLGIAEVFGHRQLAAPPGYPVLVGLARMAEGVVGELAAYPMVNTTLAFMAAIVGFWAFCSLGVPKEGLLAVTLYLFHPLTIGGASRIMTYGADAVAGISLVAGLILLRRRPPWLSNLFLLVAGFVICGFRAVSAAAFAPLVLAVLVVLRGRDGWLNKVWAACVVYGAGVLGAYAMTVYLGGGLETYRRGDGCGDGPLFP